MRRVHAMSFVLLFLALGISSCSLRHSSGHINLWDDVSEDVGSDAAVEPGDDLLTDNALPPGDQMETDLQDLPQDLLPGDATDVTDVTGDQSDPDVALPDTKDTTPECEIAADCPAGSTPCMVAICFKGHCAEGALPAETMLPQDNLAGDCLWPKCLANGVVMLVAHEADVPQNLDPCLVKSCQGGEVQTTPAASGTLCEEVKQCDGNGKCVECLTANDCPGDTSECLAVACLDGTCGFAPVAEGTPVSGDPAGDCRYMACNGEGGQMMVWDDTDVAPDDGNACTVEYCNEGALGIESAPIGTTCAYNGGAVCNEAGGCVPCVTNADCVVSICIDNQCYSSACGDSMKNGNETDVDCGANCPTCDPGEACLVATDCTSGSCVGAVCL